MINIMTEKGLPQYGLKEFVLDSWEDFGSLPTNCAPGSRAFIIQTGKVYILNSQRKWREISNNDDDLVDIEEMLKEI